MKTDVLIVGAGIAGLALALALARAGRRVQVLDAKPAFPFVPRGPESFEQRVYALSPANVAWLTELRVWGAMDPGRVLPVHDMRVHGDVPLARLLPGLPATRLGEDGLHLSAYRSGVGELCWIIEERELARVLEAAAGFAANIEILRPVEPALLLQKADGAQLRLADGRTCEAQLVVACDGASSWVRAAAAIDVDVIEYGKSAVVANFHAERPHQNCAYQWFTQDREDAEEGSRVGSAVLAWLPLPAGQVSMVWSVSEARARQLLALDGNALADEAAQAGGHTLGSFTPAGVPAAFKLRNLRARTLIAPRVALAGDAAHVVHPLAGQGLNLGLADVRALSEALAGRRDCGEYLALRAYERARKAAILEMHAVTHGLERLFSARHPAARALRNIGLNLASHLPVLPQLIARHAARS